MEASIFTIKGGVGEVYFRAAENILSRFGFDAEKREISGWERLPIDQYVGLSEELMSFSRAMQQLRSSRSGDDTLVGLTDSRIIQLLPSDPDMSVIPHSVNAGFYFPDFDAILVSIYPSGEKYTGLEQDFIKVLMHEVAEKFLTVAGWEKERRHHSRGEPEFSYCIMTPMFGDGEGLGFCDKHRLALEDITNQDLSWTTRV